MRRRLAALLRALRPPRGLRPTRLGFLFVVGSALAGAVAVTSGNNLLFLTVGALLGLISASGNLSELVFRRVTFSVAQEGDAFAGTAALFLVEGKNSGRFPVFSLQASLRGDLEGVRQVPATIPGLARGEGFETPLWATFPRRGLWRLEGLRVSTLFPFGFFEKSGRIRLPFEVVVFPPVRPMTLPVAVRGAGENSVARGGAPAGGEFHSLREFLPGDPLRSIHWRATARTGTLVRREFEREGAPDLLLTLRGLEGLPADRIDEALSAAASIGAAVVREGGRIALDGPSPVPAGSSPEHLRTIFRALALYDPAAPCPPGGAPVGALSPLGLLRSDPPPPPFSPAPAGV